MRRSIAIGFVLFGLVSARPSAAQRLPLPELGTQAGLTILNSDGAGTRTQFSVPGGGILTAPTLYATFFVTRKLALEPHVNFLHDFSDFGGTRFSGALNLVHFPEGGDASSPYLLVGGAFLGGSGESHGGLSAGVGYRALLGGRLALRPQAQYRRWFADSGLNEITLTVGVGLRVGSD